MRSAISSRENPAVKNAVKLISSAKHRKEQGLFFAEGVRLCTDAVKSGITVRQLFYTRQAMEKQESAVRLLQKAAGDVFEISPEISQRLGDTQHPQGVFCVCERKEHEAFFRGKIGNHQRWIGLESIQDPSNMGTILRTAEALGIGAALMTQDCCDIYSPKVLRGSMGAVFRLPVLSLPDAGGLLAFCRKKGLISYAAVPSQDAEPVTKCRFSGKEGNGAAIWIGNEGNGLKKETAAACDKRITIPMLGRAESLNAAVAASILMWEMTREDGREG